MKYFIVSDVHGFYDSLITALDNAGYDKDNPEHIFVSIGDLFDRGDQNVECLNFVNLLPNDRKILIYGNHEFYLMDAWVREHFRQHDFHNETDKTCYQFYNYVNPKSSKISDKDILKFVKTWEPLKKYYDSLKYYYVIDDYVLVHGWFPYWCRCVEDLTRTDWIDWYDAVWEDGPRYWHNGSRIKDILGDDGKFLTTICGHVHSFIPNKKYHFTGKYELPEIIRDEQVLEMDNEPFIDDCIIDLDSATSITRKINVYIVEK